MGIRLQSLELEELDVAEAERPRWVAQFEMPPEPTPAPVFYNVAEPPFFNVAEVPFFNVVTQTLSNHSKEG